MNTIFTILAEASLSMGLFYAVYWFFLRGERFFRLNRFYLLGALLLSVMIPLFPVHYTVFAEASGYRGNMPPAGETFATGLLQGQGIAGKGSTPFGLTLLGSIYLAGAAFVFVRLVFQSGQILAVIFRSPVRRYNRIKIVQNEQYNVPFSFFNHVFFNSGVHSEEELSDIIVHEEVHIRECHWIDLLVAELLGVVFWFNPFVWLFGRSIRQNHEYLADAGVLAQGRPVGRYQALLINQLMGEVVVGFASHLNFALNVNRFKMMTKTESKKSRVLRMVWALPVVALLGMAFAKPDYQNRFDGQNIISDDQSLPLQNNRDGKARGIVLRPDGKPLENAVIVVRGTTTGTVSGKDGSFVLQLPANASGELVISHVGYESVNVAQNVTLSEKPWKVTMKEVVIGISTDMEKMAPPPPPPAPEPTGVSKKKTTPGEGEVIFTVVEDMPQYPGGAWALGKYVKETEKKLSTSKNLKGKAVVEFTVNEKGNPDDIVVKEYDNEKVKSGAVDLVKKMEQWKPGRQRGKPVPVKYALSVEF
jgi:hypothetical protein